MKFGMFNVTKKNPHKIEKKKTHIHVYREKKNTHTDIVYENFSQKKTTLYYSVGNFTQKLRKNQ